MTVIPVNINGCNSLFCVNCAYSSRPEYVGTKFTSRDDCKRRQEFLRDTIDARIKAKGTTEGEPKPDASLQEPQVVIVIEQGTLRCVAAKHEPFVYRLIDLDTEDPPEDYEADTITDDLNAFTEEIIGGN